jgi:DNA-binding MarR family transcriptional regulator
MRGSTQRTTWFSPRRANWHVEMASSQKNPLEELYRRPGFMIRRMHQIAVSLFLAETGSLGVTNRQYGILFVLKHLPGIDQITVANLLGLDRSTTGMVLKKLEQDGLVARSVGARDRRRHSLRLTRSGGRTVRFHAKRTDGLSCVARQVFPRIQRIDARSA